MPAALLVNGAKFRASLDRVAQFRKLTLTPLVSLLVGDSELAQARWVAWLGKQRLESTVRIEFSAVLDYVVAFAADQIVNIQAQTSEVASAAAPAAQSWLTGRPRSPASRILPGLHQPST
jgi:hypothetical protein